MVKRSERSFLVLTAPELSRKTKSFCCCVGFLPISTGDKKLLKVTSLSEINNYANGDTFPFSTKCFLSVGHNQNPKSEVEIGEKVFGLLFRQTRPNYRIKKKIHLIPRGRSTIKVNIFEQELTGLVIATVEFISKEDAKRFQPLPWFDQELDPEQINDINLINDQYKSLLIKK